MENRAHALAAGLFTLLLGAALAIVALWFSKEDLKLIPYMLTTKSSVTGLKVEAPVRYRGVDVGKVDEITIDTANSGRVKIRIGVREGTPITKSTYAQLGFQGITGLTYVLLGDDGKSAEALHSSAGDIALIRMKPSLMDDGEGLFSSFVEIADKVNRLLDDENQGRVRRTLAGLEEVTQRASAVTKKLEPTLDAMPGLIGEAKGLALDARASMKKIDQLTGSVNGLALKLDQRVDTLTHAVASVEEVGVTARSVGDETMPRMNVLIDDLSKETHALGRVINTLGDHPQSLVFGVPLGLPGPGEPGFTGGR
jgi:phospholipid/cholesterol/gamma-HCH transport system substrate-binding protein